LQDDDKEYKSQQLLAQVIEGEKGSHSPLIFSGSHNTAPANNSD